MTETIDDHNSWIPSCCGAVVTILFIFCFIYIICCAYKKYKDKTRPEILESTNETFIIQNHKNEPDWVGKEVVKRLSNLANKTDLIVNYMHQNVLPNKVVADRLLTRWKKIRSNPRGLREVGLGEKTAAYTVNKSDQIRICIRNPDPQGNNDLFENENDSMLVLLHELAHVMSKGYGHDVEFKRNFSYIVRLAVKLGIYNYVDYTSNPTNYCGTDITNNAY
jgi:hypothetical protein